MGPAIEISGGSAANTMVGVASFGARAAYLGKVRDDQLGDGVRARHPLDRCHVRRRPPRPTGPRTGRCLIIVTPDAQRTMNTYLGASALLGPDDVDVDLVAAAQVMYLEGYLWDRPEAKEAYRKAARIAHEAGNEVSLTLSDSFCVDRHRTELLRTRRGRGRHPVRQRGRDLRAVRVRLRRTRWKRCAATAASPRSTRSARRFA